MFPWTQFDLVVYQNLCDNKTRFINISYKNTMLTNKLPGEGLSLIILKYAHLKHKNVCTSSKDEELLIIYTLKR